MVIMRPGNTPTGVQVRGHLRRMVRRIRLHWPHTRITIRGDGHYGRHEVMSWCEANGLKYIFGLSGNAILDKSVEPFADDIRVRRAEAQARLDILRKATTAETGPEFLQASAQASGTNRASSVLIHYAELARQTAGQLPGDRCTDRQYRDRQGADRHLPS